MKRRPADYGSKADPFKNIRAATCLGIEPWKAALLRARDKWSRIEAYIENGSLQNESLEDSLMDGAAYFLIALAMRREKLGIPLNLKKMSDAEGFWTARSAFTCTRPSIPSSATKPDPPGGQAVGAVLPVSGRV
jgi:hypothetical protein